MKTSNLFTLTAIALTAVIAHTASAFTMIDVKCTKDLRPVDGALTTVEVLTHGGIAFATPSAVTMASITQGYTDRVNGEAVSNVVGSYDVERKLDVSRPGSPLKYVGSTFELDLYTDLAPAADGLVAARLSAQLKDGTTLNTDLRCSVNH